MLYAEILNTVVTKYPLTIYQIRTMYPNVSWPDEPNESALHDYDLYRVYETTPPTVKRNQTLTEGVPVYNTLNQRWEQTWVVTAKNLNTAKTEEKLYLAGVRYEKEIEGVDWNYDENTVVRIQTDREDQTKILAAYVKAINNAWADNKPWKFGNNVFKPMTNAKIIEMGDAVGEHIQQCFDREAALADQIDACTTIDDIENWTWEES